tara:strand:+ start:357 stop:902 length:546 start_codon:yes stop_codon:yes gene_type:complete
MHFNKYKIYHFIDKLNKEKLKKINKNISLIYRNYNKKPNKQLLLNLKNFCRKRGIKIYISNDIKLALKFNFDGIYIPSFNKQIKQNLYFKKKNFSVIGSAHNIYQIKNKEMQNVEYIFISPIFYTKKTKKKLDIHNFNYLLKLTKMKAIALGGINEINIKKIPLTNAKGFASITYIDNFYQ